MSGIVKLTKPKEEGDWCRVILIAILYGGALLFQLLPRQLYAQQNTHRFEHLTIDDGLSQNNVQCIAQDYRGFLWVGTYDGLNRYDGYEFEEYKFRPADSTSLIDNNVQVLFEDSQNRLWVGAGGLNLYDRCLDRFKRIVTPEDFSAEILTLNIIDIEEDKNGDLWFAMEDIGLYRLQLSGSGSDSKALNELEYQLVGPYPYFFNDNGLSTQVKINDLLLLGRCLWVTHDKGMSCIPLREDGSAPPPEQINAEQVVLTSPNGFTGYWCLKRGRAQSLWVGTSQGLIYMENPGRSDAYRFFPYPKDFFSNDWEGIPKKIISAPDGKLWIGTYYGVIIFDPRDKSFRQLLNDPEDPESISFNNIADMVVDDGKVIWLGTVGMGLDKFVSNAKAFYHYLDKRQQKQIFSIFGILEDEGGDLWISANTGALFRFERPSGKVVPAALPPSGDWIITHMVKDNKGDFWITNNRWLVHLNPADGRMREYKLLDFEEAEVQSDSTYVVQVDYNNDVWLCNTRRLRRFDPSSGTFSNYLLPDLNLEKIEALHRDERGRFWIASARGLLSFDTRSGRWKHYQSEPDQPDSLAHYHIKSLLPDPLMPQRYLWIGTAGGGLHRLDKEKNNFSKYTEAEGLSNNFIYGILPDDSDELWISTNHGLSRFDPKEEVFTSYEVNDGLQSNEFNSRAFHKSKAGELFFGGINGITAFFPWQIQPNPHIPDIVLTDMELSYKLIEPGRKGSPLEHTVMETGEVFLAHHQNNIAFQYAALDFAEPQNNQYRFMLEGFDEDWVDAGTEREASYTNLPPGDYIFRVQGANNDGIWNTAGTSIDLTIAPPQWNTWWSYLLYLSVLGLIIYTVMSYVFERRQMREKLHLKNMEAKHLAELDQFKSQFFANVSHEFRTPIALIQGRIDEMLSLLKRPDLREKLFSMKRNSQQLLRLIDQLLDIARLESSKMALTQVPGDIVRFLRILTFSLQSAAESKDVSLTFASGTEQVWAVFDPDAMQKIVQNLISNAIKFSPPGGKVRIELEKLIRTSSSGENAQAQLRIKVMDEGVGIREQDIPQIFERFYQTNQETDIPERGFGLGLALVKELVTLHGGTIAVESKPDQGATFLVDLPLVAPDENSQPLPEGVKIDTQLLELEMSEFKGAITKLAPTPKNISWRPIRSKLVLVVEDHQELREYITGILEPAYKVIQAEDGKVGYEIAVSDVPDLIVSDVRMPRMNGYELSQALKKDHRTSHIPVVLLTAKAETKDRLEGLESGVDDFLVKPVNETELRTRVDNLIQQRETLKEKYSQSLLGGSGNVQGDSQEELFLKKVKAVIEENLEDDNFGVEVLAKEVGMSASQLYRKLRSLTELSTVQLIQQFRLERSAALLEKGYNVTEVAYKVGLRSPAYFSQLFKKHFGCRPKEYVKG